MATAIFLLFFLGFNTLFYLLLNNIYYLPLIVLLSFVLSGITCILLIIILTPFFRFSSAQNRFKHYFIRSFLSLALKLIRIDVKVHGLENLPESNNFVLFPNHKSYCDVLIVLVNVKRPISIIAKPGVFKLPIVSSYMKGINIVALNRENDREAVQAILKGIQNLKMGLPMLIFPEGGRKNRDTDRMLELKAGAFKLATKPEAMIIPVSIKGNAKIRQRKIWQKKKIELYFHKALSKDIYQDLQTSVISEKVMETVNSVL